MCLWLHCRAPRCSRSTKPRKSRGSKRARSRRHTHAGGLARATSNKRAEVRTGKEAASRPLQPTPPTGGWVGGGGAGVDGTESARAIGARAVAVVADPAARRAVAGGACCWVAVVCRQVEVRGDGGWAVSMLCHESVDAGFVTPSSGVRRRRLRRTCCTTLPRRRPCPRAGACAARGRARLYGGTG